MSTSMVSVKVAQEYLDIAVSRAEKEGGDKEPQSLSLTTSTCTDKCTSQSHAQHVILSLGMEMAIHGDVLTQ